METECVHRSHRLYVYTAAECTVYTVHRVVATANILDLVFLTCLWQSPILLSEKNRHLKCACELLFFVICVCSY